MSTIKKDTIVATMKTYDLAKPVEAVQMATVLKNIVVKQNLYSNIKGKNYAHVEGWQLAGLLTGLEVIIDEEPRNISDGKGEIKYSASAKLFKGDAVVGKGYAICSSKELTKKSFDEYAIYSMAQTRAIGKAYRNKIGFIMKLAGFQATPSEEMHKAGEVPPEAPNISVTEAETSQVPQHVCSKCDVPIFKEAADYSQRLYGKKLCREDQKNAKKK